MIRFELEEFDEKRKDFEPLRVPIDDGHKNTSWLPADWWWCACPVSFSSSLFLMRSNLLGWLGSSKLWPPSVIGSTKKPTCASTYFPSPAERWTINGTKTAWNDKSPPVVRWCKEECCWLRVYAVIFNYGCLKFIYSIAYMYTYTTVCSRSAAG